MKIQEVKKLSHPERMMYFIKEREKVRQKKLADLPKPWTDDVILQSYRFCNIRRMDDKVSQWLLHNWYEPYFDHPNMLLACALARFINKPETLEHTGFPDHWNTKVYMRRLREYRDAGNTVFNGAYVVRGNDGEDKIESVVRYYVDPLKNIDDKILNTDRMGDVHQRLCDCYGFGSFMAGQVTADLRWAMSGKWIDKLEWTPVGPGSKRGINRYYSYAPNSPLNKEEFEGMLEDFITDCQKELPNSITSRLEGIDYQNCCCEFDKYERTLEGTSKPKQKYPGKE